MCPLRTLAAIAMRMRTSITASMVTSRRRVAAAVVTHVPMMQLVAARELTADVRRCETAATRDAACGGGTTGGVRYAHVEGPGEADWYANRVADAHRAVVLHERHHLRHRQHQRDVEDAHGVESEGGHGVAETRVRRARATSAATRVARRH